MTEIPRKQQFERLPICTGTTKLGKRCSKPVADWDTLEKHGLLDRKGAGDFCLIHLLGPTALARRGGLARAANMRMRKPPPGISDLFSEEDILRRVAPALLADDEAGFPDYSTRLAAAGVVLSVFPTWSRTTPQQAQALLEAALPKARCDCERAAQEQLEAEAAFEAMRNSWDKEKVRHNLITGLYTEPYPSYMIGSWEDEDVVRASQPKPKGRLESVEVANSSGGPTRPGLLLDRDGEKPVLVPED